MSWYFYILASLSALRCSLSDVWWSEPDPFLHSFSSFPASGLLVLGWVSLCGPALCSTS